jgi:multicomponent Na+:H+ antiporter subunit D
VNWNAWLPVLVVASSLLPGLIIFFLREGSHRLRTILNMAGAVFKLVLVGLLIWGVFHEQV